MTVAPVLVGHARDQAVAGDAGVVDEDVDVAGLLDERAPPARRSATSAWTARPPISPRDRLRLVGARAVADHDRAPGRARARARSRGRSRASRR